MKNNLIIIFLSIFFSIVLWVSVTLSNRYYSSIKIPIKIANSSDNLTASKLSADKIMVKIRGTGWDLIGFLISGSKDYYVNIPNQSGFKNIHLASNSIESQFQSYGIEVAGIQPDIISLFVEKYIVKKVKVKIDTSLSFKSGYGISANIKVIPDSISISGAASVINGINYIYTEKIYLHEADEKTHLFVPLKRISNIDLSQNEVKIILDIQQIVDKNIEEIDVEILNKPEDKDIVLLPNKIGIGISGGIDVVGKLNFENVKAYIEYQDILDDSLQSVKPNIYLPGNVHLVYVKPERIKYIIKKISN